MHPIVERLFMLLLKRGSGELLAHSILACVQGDRSIPTATCLFSTCSRNC
jgi:hypothetical protein